MANDDDAAFGPREEKGPEFRRAGRDHCNGLDADSASVRHAVDVPPHFPEMREIQLGEVSREQRCRSPDVATVLDTLPRQGSHEHPRRAAMVGKKYGGRLQRSRQR